MVRRLSPVPHETTLSSIRTEVPMARQQSHGQCNLCKSTFSKNTMTRHLTKCLQTHESKEPVGKETKGKRIHFVVEGKNYPQYWLHLELPATAKLQHLDQFLRKIWLECC